jgi:hypothetical protein
MNNCCHTYSTSKRARATHVIYYIIKTYIMNLTSHLAFFYQATHAQGYDEYA